MTNIEYCKHDFKAKGAVVESWTDRAFNRREYQKLQEMECTNCGITTYYLVE